MVLLRIHPTGRADVLLIRRSEQSNAHPGRWAVPGGFVETASPKGVAWAPGTETPHAAVLRELREETGLDVSALAPCVREIEVRERIGRDPRDDEQSWTRTHVFLLVARADEVAADPVGGDDAGEARWVPLAEALAMDLAFDHSDMLRVATARVGL